MADSVFQLFAHNAFGQTGENFIDEEVLRSTESEFDEYNIILESDTNKSTLLKKKTTLIKTSTSKVNESAV